MLVLRDRLIGLPIMSLQTGNQLGATSALIIDPRRLHILAFYCEGAGIEFQPAVLHTSDIREFSDIGLIINDSEDIMPADDLVRLKEVLDFHFQLEGKKVIEDNGRKLGKIANFATDTSSFYITKLHVQPSLLQSLSAAEHIVDRSQIVTVTNDNVIVRQATVKEEVHKPAVHHTVNPFRKPQAETSDVRKTE